MKQNQVLGKIHSFQSLGTVDGPGVRFVVFLQGYPLRCAYCHNPEMWNMQKPNYTPEELAKKIDAEIINADSVVLYTVGNSRALDDNSILSTTIARNKNSIHHENKIANFC